MSIAEGRPEAQLADVLLPALAGTHAGLCVCDGADRILYANPTFRRVFFGDPGDEPSDFVDGLARAIAAGKGIKLTSMPLDAFVDRVRKRRRAGPSRYDFAVDLADGSWWWVNDHRLSNGWLVVVATDVSRLKSEELALREAHARAEKASITDELTGLANRRSGIHTAVAALEEHRADKRPLTIAVLDVDRFKAINDGYGHEVGDRVLVQFAGELTRGIGAGGHASRIGGEEFMVVLPGCPLPAAAERLETMLRRLSAVPLSGGRRILTYTFSGGLASPERGETFKDVLGRADGALYEAKSQGRGRLVLARPLRSAA